MFTQLVFARKTNMVVRFRGREYDLVFGPRSGQRMGLASAFLFLFNVRTCVCVLCLR